MGLPLFFDRAKQSAAQVLRDFDPKLFEKRLGDVVVTIAFDTQAATSAEGLAVLDLAARLVARLYPRVRVLALDGEGALAEKLAELMQAINPNIEIVENWDGEQVALVAGTTPFNADLSVYMGSDRWVGEVSTSAPIGSGSSPNPFGAGAAACIAVANIFRVVFASWLVRPSLDVNLKISTLNFETGTSAANADLQGDLDLGVVQLVGVGAIGNAFVWSMSCLQSGKGLLHLIDHENVELTNLQRYVLPMMADDGASKVELAAAALSGGVTALPFPGTWADYVRKMGHSPLDTVAVALDTARDRVLVQSSLPRRIINSWTQTGDLGISRHTFDSDNACLACLYLPSGRRRNEDEIVAEELGFPSDQVNDVRAMLHFGTLVTDKLARTIAKQVAVPAEALLPYVGLPLRSFRQKAVCGNAIMRAVDGGGSDIEVPMAFQSALAGVLLAAEVVASASGARKTSIGVTTVIDLMRRMPPRITFPVRKNLSGSVRCICEDADYLDAYKKKYS